MSVTETKPNTIYLIGLTPEEESTVWEDFRAYPFPGWQLAVLQTGVAPPLDILEGRAILVMGCGGLRVPDHTETIWRLRLLVCANPWLAVVADPKQTAAEICTAAGAAASLTRPFSPAKLRELIWHHALPWTGHMPIAALTCERLVRYCAIMGADVLLKFSSDNGRTGFLGLKRGQPFHAQLLDGTDGGDALREILSWGKGKVLSLPVPGDLRPNLPERSEIWQKLLRTNSDDATMPNRAIPGGIEACDRILSELSDGSRCYLVDYRTQRVVGHPTGQMPARDVEREIVTTTLELLQTPACIPVQDRSTERVDEIVLWTSDGWCAAFRVADGRFAFVLAVPGQAQWVLVRQLLNDVAQELERQSELVVESMPNG